MKLNRKKLLPWVILTVGIVISTVLVLTKTTAQKKEANPDKVQLVRVMEVSTQNKEIHIQAFALTTAAKSLNLSAQVSGRVKWVSPIMTEGAWIKKGQLLFRLDPDDYHIKVEQAQAGLAKAEYDLENALAQQKVAQDGLRSYQKVQNSKEGKLKISPLALYAPQIKLAKSSMKSAKASLRQAELYLARTEVKAPFDGILRAVNIAEGQVIAPGQAVAGYFSSQPIRLKVTVPLSELPWVRMGTKVTLQKKIGQQWHQWEGQVEQRLMEIDSLGHMAQVMVEVANTTSDQGFPLPVGMQLQVNIQGEDLKERVAIPLYALRTNDQAWVVDSQSMLEIKKLKVLRKAQGVAFISEGLQKGDQLIISNIDGAIAGMKVKIYKVQIEKDYPLAEEEQNSKRKEPVQVIPQRSP